MKFSIIVPVYNVDKYLRQCVNSVERQDYKNYEIILVDDGSTDDSPIICDEFKQKNTAIKVIHKKNGGLSDARNIGTEQAKGEYVIYLDSDDYWNDTAFLSKIYTLIDVDKPDLLVFGYKKVLDNRDMFSYIPHSKSDSVEELVKAGEFNICAWDKVVKRELLISNNIFFRKNVYSEDMEWCSLLFKYVEKISILSETPYSYRQRTGSITKKISEKNIADIKDNFEKCLLIKRDMSHKKSLAFEYYLAKNMSMFMIALSNLKKQNQSKYYKFIVSNINFLKKYTRKRELLIYMSTKILGISVTESLLSCVSRIMK